MSNIIKAATGDEDLKYVILCQKGETDAFEVLVERHQKKMLNIAFRMMGDSKRKLNFPRGCIESLLTPPKTV